VPSCLRGKSKSCNELFSHGDKNAAEPKSGPVTFTMGSGPDFPADRFVSLEGCNPIAQNELRAGKAGPEKSGPDTFDNDVDRIRN
jgi:hypothetical protein